ncbi:MAG: helix-turn-helix domain-containing protein [Crocinitomicaceae bacterium]
MSELLVLDSISKAHELLGLKKPTHPLISVVAQKDLDFSIVPKGMRVRIDLFQIWMKSGVECQIGYGRNTYDFDEGTLAFVKPGQVISSVGSEGQVKGEAEGYVVMFHPDLIRKSALSTIIDQYAFFNYEVHEALHISDAEKLILHDIIRKMQAEIGQNIDQHSQALIISNLELFLGYCTRYYDRQFYTRTNLNKDLITQFNDVLKDYYQTGKQSELGIPTVSFCAKELNMSANYLGDLLKKETGMNTQEHIQDFVVNKAKNKLLGTTDSLSEIAYGLGYEYPQHFSKVFKKKVGQTPSAYRQLN